MRRSISGIYFDGRDSGKCDAELHVTGTGEVAVTGPSRPAVPLSVLSVSPRLGDSPRYIGFPDGAQFETRDNDAVDAILLGAGRDRGSRLIHLLECNRRAIAATVLIVVLGSWAVLTYGIPWLARELAMVLPEEAARYMGDGVLETLDEYWLEPSTLPQAVRDRLDGRFRVLAEAADGATPKRLVFRGGEDIGANAFALPDGTIILTDELVRLAAHDGEIVAVMLHEIGHVHHRHSLRTAIQQFGLTMLVMVVTGDVSASSSVVTALPVVLVESGYSRAMEREADGFALAAMRDRGIAPSRFAVILEKLEFSQRPAYRQCRASGREPVACLETAPGGGGRPATDGAGVGHYLSTHPHTDERIAHFRQADSDGPVPTVPEP